MTATEVEQFLQKVTPAKRQRDARTLLELMGRVTEEPPRLDGTIVGFGSYHYRYESGREGDTAAAAFAPRKAATVVYLMDGVDAHAEDLERLGPHSTGVACLYLKDLEQVDLSVLERILADSWRTLTQGTETKQGRDARR